AMISQVPLLLPPQSCRIVSSMNLRQQRRPFVPIRPPDNNSRHSKRGLPSEQEVCRGVRLERGAGICPPQQRGLSLQGAIPCCPIFPLSPQPSALLLAAPLRSRRRCAARQSPALLLDPPLRLGSR